MWLSNTYSWSSAYKLFGMSVFQNVHQALMENQNARFTYDSVKMFSQWLKQLRNGTK